MILAKDKASPSNHARRNKPAVGNTSAESWVTQQAHYDLGQVRAGWIKLNRLRLA